MSLQRGVCFTPLFSVFSEDDVPSFAAVLQLVTSFGHVCINRLLLIGQRFHRKQPRLGFMACKV